MSALTSCDARLNGLVGNRGWRRWSKGVEITDDAEAAAHRLADRIPTATAEDILAAPYALIGTVEEIASEVRRHQQRWGFTRFAVRAPHHEAASRVLARLTALERG